MTLFKKYWPLLLVSLLVGLFSILPLVFSLQRMGGNFQGIWPQFNGDANFYLSRAHEVSDGHVAMNNSYFFEGKDVVYPQANGGEIFLGVIARTIHISIPALQAALTFISPALMAALMYLFLMMLYLNRVTAFMLSGVFFTVVTGGMTKPIHPGISFPLLLLFLISWARLVLKKEHRGLSAVLCGVFLGLLFLTYFFHWSFLLVVLGVYGLILLITKDFQQLKHHIIFLVIAAIIAIPFFTRAFTGIDSSLYAEMAVRMGVYATHWPETFPRLAVALIWLAFFIFVTRHYKLNRDKRSHIIFALLVANVIYPNHQVITGITIENASHWAFMPVFLYMLSGHYLYHSIYKGAMDVRMIFARGLVVMMVAVPAWRLSTFIFYPRRIAKFPAAEESQQQYADVLQWLNSNTPADSVVFSNFAFMRLVPVYTRANVYYTENAPYLLVSDTEVIERTLLAHFFIIDDFVARDFEMNDIARILWTQPAMIERNIHWLHDRLGIGYELRYTFARELALVRSVYVNLKQAGWNINLLRRYRLDYIVWDKSLFPEWNLDNYSELKKVYEKNNVMIFIFKDNINGN